MNARETLLLGRDAIARTMTFGDYVAAIENAFCRYAAGEMIVADVLHLPASDGGVHVKSAAFRDTPRYVAVKVNANFPQNPERHGLPTVQGVITFLDGENGFPLALLDSMEVTTHRTAAATAVAAKHLARPDSRIATIVGCGIQGRAQLEALRHVLPIEQVHAFDVNADRRRAFARDSSDRGGHVLEAEDLTRATLASDVIVTCTSSRSAFLGPSHVRPGTFIAAVGADHEYKQEIEPALMARSRVVVDILEQCERMGDLHHALDAGVLRREDVHGELGAIVRGTIPGRTDAASIFVFDSTGSAIQDVAAAQMIYERAREQELGSAFRLS